MVRFHQDGDAAGGIIGEYIVAVTLLVYYCVIQN